MLRFFRQYILNQWTLVIGGVILMIVFLLPAGLGRSGGAENQVIGRVDGHKVRMSDLRWAQAEIHVADAISPLLGRRLSVVDGEPRVDQFDALQWVLMLQEAEQMGLSASEYEIQRFLTEFGADNRVNQIGSRLGMSEAAVRQAVRNRIIIQRYLALVGGLANVPVEEGADFFAIWARNVNDATQTWVNGDPITAMAILESAHGRVRVSDAVVERFLHDALATVKVQIVPVNTSRYMDKVAEPDESRLVEFFERYKGELRGQSEPYGFGYKFPDRVQVEYLTVPMDRVREKVGVEEADAMAYYDRNPDQFREAAPAGEQSQVQAQERPVKPYPQVRDQIMAQLRDQRANELADKIVREALAIMTDNARGLSEDQGYRVVPEGWQPISLAEVAQRVQERFGLMPKVTRAGDRWYTQEDLAALEGIGQSALITGQQVIPFFQYALSARELAGDEGGLSRLRLQAQLPSQPLLNMAGDRFVFRVFGAQKEHEPASIEEVRSQVRYDVRRLDAYKLMLEERDRWLDRFATEDAASLAQDAGSVVLDPPPFPRRQRGRQTLEPPFVSEVGQSAQFVDEVFDRAQRLARGGLVAEAPAAQRVLDIALDNKLTLFLVKIVDYKPMSRGDYEQIARLEIIPFWIKTSLHSAEDDQDAPDPLAVKSIASRIGYKSETGEDIEQ